jgi:hypothetical protein
MTVGMCAAILGMTLRGAAITAPAADTGDSSATPQVATTVVPDSAGDAEKSPAPKPGLGGTFTLDNSVEGSAFYTNAYINNPAWTTNLLLRPDYSFKIGDQHLKFQLWETLSFVMWQDKETTNTQRFNWSDLRLTFSNAKIYEEPNTHIKLNGFIRGSIPLSQASQFATLYTQLSAGLGLKKSMYGFDFGLGVQIAKNFNKYTSVQYSCADSVNEPIGIDGSGNPILGFQNGICRAGDTTSMIEGVNTSWSWAPSGTVAYHFTDKLSLSLSLYYLSAYKYPVGTSTFSSQAIDSNGNLAAQTNGHSDGFWGITDLNYALTDHWSFDLGIWNGAGGAYGAPPETQSGGVPRNPFFDTYNLSDWSMFFDITASL